MSDTVFVTMYAPALGNVQVDAPLQAVSTYQAHGWLLLDPNATPPPIASPYLSQPAADSRYLRDWAGAEVLTAGAVRVAPDGHVIVRTADGTTRSTYDGTEAALWTALGGANDPALRAAYGLVVATTVTASGALVPGKHNPVDATTGALSMTLPTGAVEGASIGVEKVDSSANAVTVTGNVRGASGQSISLPWAHETLVLRADSTGSWWPVSGHKTKASLDAAFAPGGTAGNIDAPTTSRLQLRSPLMTSKILGGNITVKPGYNWIQLWAEWDWDNWIKPQVDRAVALGLNTIRLIGAPHAPLIAPGFAAWSANAAYSNADLIRTNGANIYRSRNGGTTASSGGGPTGTGTGITDGTVVWDYVGPALPTSITQAQYNARWAQLAQYCTQRGLALYSGLCQQDQFDAVSSGNYTNASVVASICSTAAVLAAYPCVIGFDVFQEGPVNQGNAYAWQTSRGYTIGSIVYAASNAYTCTTSGTSAATGSGPTGTGASISDGTVVWSYTGPMLLPSDVLSVYASIRAAAGGIPLTTSYPPSVTSYATDDATTWYSILYLSAAGPDFIDLHYYTNTVKPRDIDYLAFRTGKPIVIGEFGANQGQTGTQQQAQYSAILPVHQRQGVAGSIVWALADQGTSNRTDRQSGVWDNTGFVQGSAPLSATSGVRSALAAILATFPKAPSAAQYEPPNLLSPWRSRPPRSVSVPPGSNPANWSTGANTTRTGDPRGLAFVCTAGGTATRAFIGASVSVVADRLAVTTGLSYEFSVTVLSATGSAVTVQAFIDWIDSGGTFLSSSPTVSGTDSAASPLTLTAVGIAPANAAYAQPTVQWASTQATGDIRLIRKARFTQE